MPEPAVIVKGLREFRRDLKRLDPQIDRELRDTIRDAAGKVRERAEARVPHRSGRLAASLRVSVTTRGAAIYSRLPYAPVIEFGGTISPRGVPITFSRSEFVTGAAEEQADELVRDISGAVEKAALRTGWHR